jgi:ferrous-iron efflux pump FieF
MPPADRPAVTPEQGGRLMRLATYASVTVATVLILAKAVAWQVSGSVSLLATLVDSLLDALASLVNLVAVRHSLSPADKEHRFGHGKAEALAGLGQALLITGSSGYLLVESARRLVNPTPVESVGLGIAVMLLAIALTLALLAFQQHVIRATNSTAIKADALHYRTDLLVNGSVLLALVLSGWGWAGFDALFAMAIAIYIFTSALAIIREAWDHLMDRELPDEARAAIAAIARSHPEVHGIHDLRTRQSGTATFIQLHLELDDELDLVSAHAISEEVERELLATYPGAEVIIHLDPLSVLGEEPRKTFS